MRTNNVQVDQNWEPPAFSIQKSLSFGINVGHLYTWLLRYFGSQICVCVFCVVCFASMWLIPLVVIDIVCSFCLCLVEPWLQLMLISFIVIDYSSVRNQRTNHRLHDHIHQNLPSFQHADLRSPVLLDLQSMKVILCLRTLTPLDRRNWRIESHCD